VPEFLKLSKDDRKAILSEGGGRLGRLSNVLEKDIWVCWVLDRLFKMPGALQMAFKGGTSLSKAFGAIARFSEDVDVSIDYRALKEVNPFGLSGAMQNKLRKELQELVAAHVKNVVQPYFHAELEQAFGAGSATLEIQGDQADTLVVRYPSALDAGDGYMPDAIRIEFGGRNVTDPKSIRTISADLANEFSELEFPKAETPVLNLERTFWEKATLIHEACSRAGVRDSANRLSRHWYDVDRLLALEAGQGALRDLALLEDVVKHKAVFFPSKTYEDCLKGNLRLVPEGDLRKHLEADYRKMVDAGMFYKEPPKMDKLMERLSEMASAVNKARTSSGK
jgi:hypothetical protein